ncbi:MAG: hypothetical protein OZX49_01819 [Immundisolibacter sp.]|nr:hypothetical protein [Immundisolibacter sp.]
MQGVIGGTAGGQQADHAVDDGAFVHHLVQRRLVFAAGQLHRAPPGLRRQRVAQRRAGIHEGGARQVQAHQLHQHLVGVGGAVEGAGAGRVIGARFGLQQALAADLALGIQLADFRLLGVGQAGRHRPGRHEDHRQVAKGQGADQQPRHDLVAHAQAQRAVEHVVRQCHGGGQGDRVAREQRQIHAGLTLRDAVAHGRHAAGELRHGAHFRRCLLEDGRVGFERLVGRQHVVIGGHDGDVDRRAADQGGLVGRAGRRAGMRQVGAGQALAHRTRTPRVCHAGKVRLPGRLAAAADAFGNRRDYRVDGHAQSPVVRGALRRPSEPARQGFWHENSNPDARPVNQPEGHGAQ